MTTTAPPIRTAILGYGLSGRIFHGAFLGVDPDFEVSAIVTSSPERIAQARADHPGARILDSPEKIADHAAELDLAIVCTPPGAHAENIRTALRAGLDVVVDKPFVPSSTEGEALIAEAAELGRRLTVYQNRRYDADFRTLRGLIEDGSLGTVHTLESRFEGWKPAGGRGWKKQATAAVGGGTLFDFGTHLIDQCVQLLGPVTEMLADVRSHLGGPDDEAHLILTHASGATSYVTMANLSALEGPRFLVRGDGGAWRTWGKDPQEATLRSGVLPDAPGFGLETEEERGELSTGEGVTRTPAGTGEYAQFYRELAVALREGGPLPVDPADSVAVLRIIEAAHQGRTATFG